MRRPLSNSFLESGSVENTTLESALWNVLSFLCLQLHFHYIDICEFTASGTVPQNGKASSSCCLCLATHFSRKHTGEMKTSPREVSCNPVTVWKVIVVRSHYMEMSQTSGFNNSIEIASLSSESYRF